MSTAATPASTPPDPLADDTAPVVVSGVVSQLYTQKPTFSAGKLYTGGRTTSFSVKGFVEVNKPASLRGRWETHPKYGRQFKATEVVYEMPADADGMASWLASAIEGMGPAKAKDLVDAFGADLPRMLSQNPEAVAVECRLPIEFVNRTAAAWHAAADRAALGSTLYAYGLTQLEVEKLIARYKGGAKAILESDPYLILGDIPGFGWKRVDAIGKKLGVPVDHPGRVRASVITAVRSQYDEGSTCAGREGTIGAAGDLLGAAVERQVIEAGLADALSRKLLRAFGEEALSLPGVAAAETYLWRRFLSGADPHPCFRDFSEEEIASVVAAKRAIHYRGEKTELDDSQVEAVRVAISNRFCVITGGAGSGKSTVAKAICEAFGLGTRAIDQNDEFIPSPFMSDEENDAAAAQYDAMHADDHTRAESPSVALCAPTGKAARRLSEVIGREASTIHRLLGWNPETGRFNHDADNILPYDAIIIDEVSMCDAALLEDVLQAVGPDTAVVLIGDDNQLPPVGAGYPLRDLLEHNLIPVHRLTKCHRQAGKLKHNCVQILEGTVEPTVIDAGDPGPWMVHRRLETPEAILKAAEKLFVELLPAWEFGDLMAHQFVTAKHEGRLGTKKMNELLQRLAQARRGVVLAERAPDESLPLMVGDKVIQTKNNYGLGVMNGTVGVVVEDGKPLIVKYDDREVIYDGESKYDVQLAYCLSVHKMQGSEVPCIVVICPKAHAFMQHRNWLYTAATRARRTCVIMGDGDGIRRAAERVQVSMRRTILELFANNPGLRPT